jgi:hypothetical protein
MMIPALLSCPPVSSKGKRHYANMAIERIAYGDEGSAQWENRWGVISPQRSEVSASAGRGGQSTQANRQERRRKGTGTLTDRNRNETHGQIHGDMRRRAGEPGGRGAGVQGV